ncbi:MAG: Smr/MutS family protein [Gammaproteobacteria bacterium]|nr:Smr/MutS family protein [Gammaproteobacteria bacterium]
MLKTQENMRMVDLHGASPENSQRLVNSYLRRAEQENTYQFRFVTGRGNHINSRGERGTLFREFPNWFSGDNLEKIESMKKGNGYYEIHIKRTQDLNSFNAMIEKLSHGWLVNNIQAVMEGAAKNDPFDQYLLGHCHQFGIGVEKNDNAAIRCYEKSAKQNNPFAQYALGGYYWLGQSIRQSDQKAIELFMAAASQDFVWAIHQLGDIFCYGDGVEKNLEQAKDYYQRASDLGFIIATRKLGHVYFFGNGVEKDQEKGCLLYKEAADSGDAHSAFNIGCAYFYGEGIEKNPALAFKYAKQAADADDPDAQCLIARCYQFGIGTTKDELLRLNYLKRSANNNFKGALFQLAFHPSIEQTQQNDYLLGAARAGCIEAQAMVLSPIYFRQPLADVERQNIVKDFWQQEDEAAFSIVVDKFKVVVVDTYMQATPLTKKQRAKVLRLLHALAKENFPPALGQLGSLYHTGEIVKKDSKRAEQYWLKGANQRHAACLCSLGYFYEEQGAHEKAFSYHQQAAQAGSANSYNQLGLLYKSGNGIKKDIEKSIECFGEAMRLRIDIEGLCYSYVFPHAAYNLAMLYWCGDESFEADKKQALLLFEKSSKAGHEQAKIALMGLSLNLNAKKGNSASALVKKKTTIESDSRFFKPAPGFPKSKLEKYKLLNDSQENLEKGLRMAAHNNRYGDTQKFIQYVKNINAQDNNPEKRFTALHLAVLKDHKEIAQLLKNSGALVDIKDAKNKTAIDYAIELSNKEMKTILTGDQYLEPQPPALEIVENNDAQGIFSSDPAFLSSNNKYAAKDDNESLGGMCILS